MRLMALIWDIQLGILIQEAFNQDIREELIFILFPEEFIYYWKPKQQYKLFLQKVTLIIIMTGSSQKWSMIRQTAC